LTAFSPGLLFYRPWHYFVCSAAMDKNCRQFNISRHCITGIHPEHLESFFRKMVPDEQFRFITFQAADYRQNQLTFLLYNYIPETVGVTVERASDIEPAIEQLQQLNPGVEWSGVQLKYFDRDETGASHIVIELQLIGIPMRVSAGGQLIAL